MTTHLNKYKDDKPAKQETVNIEEILYALEGNKNRRKRVDIVERKPWEDEIKYRTPKKQYIVVDYKNKKIKKFSTLEERDRWLMFYNLGENGVARLGF